MEIQFNGKSALVTGGSQGIGRAIVTQLAKCGAKVVAVDINKEQLDNLKQEIPSVTTVQVDLSDWSGTRAALAAIGPIDLLVNNAGLAVLKPLSENTERDFDRLFNLNVKALMNVTQIISDNMLSRKAPGSIVNISSQASKAGLKNHTIYCATKGAVDAFTRAAALELGPHNIRVNCVNPTVVMTELGKLAWSDPKVGTPMLEKIPMGRFGQVHEVVDAVVFLLSDKASMITGSCLPVDGGFLAV